MRGVARKAVWSHAGLVGVQLAEGDHRYDCVRMTEDVARAQRTAEAVTMQEVIEASGFPRIDLLKIDIEGAEVELFKGDTEWLSRVGAIAIEFHGESRRESGFDHLMDRFGLVIAESGGHTVLALRQSGWSR